MVRIATVPSIRAPVKEIAAVVHRARRDSISRKNRIRNTLATWLELRITTHQRILS